ncbi:S8 family serine peptidase [Sphingobium sp. LB126]|uniref:S8 family serine peptidase n=1 Tax=Sphingobium sp. LB126 TaxID=1983755 RepID=UPI001F5B1B96|nr:S8 family serine peptidase [Sphingobium sp. LB126]
MTGRIMLLITAACLIQPGIALAKAGDPIPNSYICTFKPGPISSGSEARISVAAVGGRVTHVYSHALNGFAAHLPAAAVQKMMAKNPLIQSCQQDRVATIPPTIIESVISRGGPVGGGGGSTQTTPWGVKRVGGPVNYAGSNVVWIIDTGIDLSHPDLAVDVDRSISYVPGASNANDGNGHGTHVAGIIAAKNNGTGVVGVAAGATVVAVQVLDSTGSGADADVVSGIDYATANGKAGDVINLSLITSPMPAMDLAVTGAASKGIFVAIAAGNSSVNAADYSPARVNGTGIYTLAATDSKDIFARYSNYGKPPVDYAEPGSSILSTYKNGSYATLSGTSMAAPHMAGILLLNGANGPSASGVAQRDPDPAASYSIGAR